MALDTIVYAQRMNERYDKIRDDFRALIAAVQADTTLTVDQKRGRRVELHECLGLGTADGQERALRSFRLNYNYTI